MKINKINMDKVRTVKETVKTIVISATVGAVLGAYGMHSMAQSNSKQVQAALSAVTATAHAQSAPTTSK